MFITFYFKRGGGSNVAVKQSQYSASRDQPSGSLEGLNSNGVLPIVKADHIKLYVWFGKLSASIKRF